MTGKTIDLKQEKFLKEFYILSANSDEELRVSEIDAFLLHSLSFLDSQDDILKEAGRLLFHITPFKEIAFGIRDADGKYRYRDMVGFRKEAVDARNAITYEPRDLTDGVSFKSFKIGRFTHIHLAEFEPFKPGEELTYNHPELLGKPRTNPDDIIEGDYLDVYLFGNRKEIIGWIELLMTKNGKLPTREDMLLIEFFASCLALLLMPFQKNSRKIRRS